MSCATKPVMRHVANSSASVSPLRFVKQAVLVAAAAERDTDEMCTAQAIFADCLVYERAAI